MDIKQLKREIAKCEANIKKNKEKLDTLRNQLITEDDIVPFAVFNIIPSCQDIMVMIPLPNGKFIAGGLFKDPGQFWTGGEGWGKKSSMDSTYYEFTKSQMVDYLVYLNATKSDKKMVMQEQGVSRK